MTQILMTRIVRTETFDCSGDAFSIGLVAKSVGRVKIR
jgi:hypothetical protein